MRRAHFALLALGLMVPGFALAFQESVLDFRGSTVPGKWDVTNWQDVQTTPEGLHIRANVDGKMMRVLDVPFGIKLVQLTFANVRQPLEGVVLWHRRKTPPDNILQLPFTLTGWQNPETVTLDFTPYDEWDPHTDYFGFGLPTGADVTLQDIRFVRPSLWENITEAWKTYWIFDQYRPYSINFLWGPQLTYNAYARSVLFENLPPISHSALRLFYYVLAVAAVGLALHRFVLKKRGRHLLWFFGVFAVLWVALDARMGLELLSYAKTDLQTYIGVPARDKWLRTYRNFYAFPETSLPLIDKPRYGFLVPSGNPLPSLLTYFSYPRQAVVPSEPDMTLDHWIVFLRPDVRVNEDGELMVGETVMSRPGQIVERLDDQSFFFIANP